MMMTVIIIAAIIFCAVALLAEDFGKPRGNGAYERNTNRADSRRASGDKRDHSDVYCPECGSPNVTVFRDGTCRCQDCEFPFHVDYL